MSAASGWARRATLGAILAVLAFGCASSAQKIPFTADARSTADLAGQWEGEYSSGETGRSGTITFNLSAEADTASGDVTMLSRPFAIRRSTTEEPTGAPSQPISRTLSIKFVRAMEDHVNGRLDPYLDPDCGCILETVFEGKLENDRIEGTYTSRSQDGTNPMVRGTWFVKRVTP